MYNRLLSYLNVNNILIDNQYGFREDHSTSMVLVQMVDKVTNELDNNNYLVGVFIDLSKAFET